MKVQSALFHRDKVGVEVEFGMKSGILWIVFVGLGFVVEMNIVLLSN